MRLLLLTLLSCKHAATPGVAEPEGGYSDLTEGGSIAGFRIDGVYTDHTATRRGASLVHEHTGFVLRYITQETVPAAYMWVNTVPSDNKGAPHTQEHLLLGKGNVGRAVADAEEFQLVDSSAFTETHRTVYHFRTASGPDGFFPVLEQRLHALLEPDYTDEEIRREVYHFGVDTAEDGTLSLVEKGTVYNEMETTAQNPGSIFWTALEADLYGADHPEAFTSGGEPDPMRSLTPTEIRAFHEATHDLGNMGAVVFFPPADLEQTLGRFDAVLTGLQPEPTAEDASWPTAATLPPPKSTEDRSIRQLRFPKREGKGTVDITVAWPPRGERSSQEDILMGLFFDALADDESSNLHKALVDDETKERETGVKGVWASQYEGSLGSPVMLGGENFPLETDDATLLWVRDRMLEELATVAEWAPGDPDLVDFNRRVRNDLVPRLRQSRMTLSSPPGFGTRGTSSGWYDFLEELDEEGGFERSLALTEAYTWVQEQLAREDNIWAALIEREALLTSEPITYIDRPDPALLETIEEAREARIAEEEQRLLVQYETADVQQALATYGADLDAAAAEVEASRATTENRLIDDPPLDDDPGLSFEQRDYGGVPAVVTHFSNLTGARVSFVFDVRAVPPEHQDLMVIFESMLTETGLVLDGQPLDNDTVDERLKEQVRYVYAGTTSNARLGRLELHVTGEGTDLEETRKALVWVDHFMHRSHWEPDNLDRLRNLVRKSADRWLDYTPTSFVFPLRYQDDFALLQSNSGPGQQLNILRLNWRLRDAGDDVETVVAAFDALGRGESVDPEAHPLIAEAVRDMERMVRDLPPDTRDGDTTFLAAMLATDLRREPTEVLEDLDAVRKALFRRGSVRIEATGGEILPSLEPDILAVLEALPAEANPIDPGSPSGGALVRLEARGVDVSAGHLAWLNPEMRTGTISLSVPLPPYTDLTEGTLIDLLAARSIGGGGAKSMFMRTWGEGLAYSNGVSASAHGERMTYSANRCPDVAQTVTFASGLVSDTPVDATLAEYAISQAFTSDAHRSPQSRGASMARRLLDDNPPAKERAYREALLALRDLPDLVDRIQARQEPVYAALFPDRGGWTADSWSQVTGNEAQLESWNAYLVAAGQPEAARVYPRDFWILE